MRPVPNETGCVVITPARRKSKERGGIVIGKYGHAAAQLHQAELEPRGWNSAVGTSSRGRRDDLRAGRDR